MTEDSDLRKLVADVSAAYFSNSHVTASEIANVIGQIASSLSAVGASGAAPAVYVPEQPKLTTQQIRKSITRDALISFEDNKRYKTLRRHLSVKGLTSEQYREKWGLPKDYPMVASGYSEARSTMAKALGLGRNVVARTRSPAPVPTAASPAPKAKRKGPRRPKKVVDAQQTSEST